ncbi:MAG: LpxI family protein [Sediminimonas qiaohouensis]|uniref:LpxI family protein n=1 Tax=Sediminimonas qiaohouensis TaxID=552061 RepID=A0A7C9LBJ9_9RHOB|nr:UDP-2,3-diacylglucosamine diphosphatase LpxI [Sediminimonas qiaohouensis]MTJ05257.1 LpxI family protein [Sediminimonas qiaohouensis]
MAGRLAILAGGGALPVALARACPDALRVVFDGVAHDLAPPTHMHRFERLGALFDWLHQQGVERVVMAGSMTRPPLDPAAFDAEMQTIAPRLVAAMQEGDDGLLRFIVSLFEERGFAVEGAYEILPDLTAAEGPIAGPSPHAGIARDAARAASILAALSPLDLGQACVVEGGQCLGVETLQGTDFLLDCTARTPEALRAPVGQRGLLMKAAKRGQDLRVDMPAIGPDTAAHLARAGLAGAVIEAGRVMILERERAIEAFAQAGLFLIARRL